MAANTPLLLHEEVLLLALSDKKGTIHSGTWAQTAMGGALLGELLLEGSVRSVTDGKKQNIAYEKPTALDDEFAHLLSEDIRVSGKLRSGSQWVSWIANKKGLIHDTAARLCRRGVLRADEKSVGIFFKKKIYPELDPAPERELLGRIEEAIFGHATTVAPRTALLVALAHRTYLLNANFGKKRVAEVKDRVERISSNEFAGDATKAAVDAAQAALFLFTMMPAMMPVIIN